jgi:thioredoxin-related protein
MSKLILFQLIAFVLVANTYAQEPFKVYNPDADAQEQILAAIKKANVENKHVFLFVGGNWCKWCRMFDAFAKNDAQVDSMFNANYVTEHINFSKENKNEAVMATLDFPQRFGFPVWVILDKTGKRIHTQSTGYLEEGQGYSKEKVMEFLEQWSPKALLPETYKEIKNAK